MQNIQPRIADSSGGRELAEAKACQCAHLADEVEYSMQYELAELTEAQIVEVTTRIRRLRDESRRWMAIAGLALP